LIDLEHVVADLFGRPRCGRRRTDEQGTIVRPTEATAFGDDLRAMDPQIAALPADQTDRPVRQRARYVDASRNWVATSSEFALDAEEIRRRMQPPEDRDVRAAAHVWLARHRYGAGHVDSAERQFEAALRPCPEKWNYRRQKNVARPG
jgi:hypothetical protein